MRTILILGGGYAGVSAAKRAFREMGPEAKIQLVDRNPYHQLVTEMYRVAADDKDPGELTYPLRSLLPKEIEVIEDEVCAVDAAAGRVHLKGGEHPYDALILALGATPEFYHVPGAARWGLTLQYLDSAVRVRNRVNRLIRALVSGRAVHGAMTIVGGGLTGVECASELAEHVRGKMNQAGLPSGHITMYLVQAAPTILAGEDQGLVAYAKQRLEHLGVEVLEGQPVARVDEGSVTLKDGRAIHSDLTVWAGGVRANEVGASSGLATEPHSDRVKVDRNLSVPGAPGLFAAGDMALCLDPKSKSPLPPTAQLAVQEGRAAGANAARLLQGNPLVTFVPHMLGMTASLGRAKGIADLGAFKLKGRVAMTLKRLALLRYLYSMGGLSVGLREPFFHRSQPSAERKTPPISPSARAHLRQS